MREPDRSALAPRTGGGFRVWVPTLAMMLVSLISYLDRNTLALLAPTLLEEAHLSGRDYGLVISAFSLAYTIGNPIWGRLLDRTGIFGGMLVAVALWSAASTAHAFATGFLSFAAARAVLGFGEGATFPGGMRVVAGTLPEDKRARGLALAYSGGALGAIVTPLVVTPIAAAFGVRAAFLWTGGIGASWIVLWLLIGRSARVAPARADVPPPRLRDRRTLAFVAAYALGGIPLAFVLYIAPIYLHRALGVSQVALGRLLWIPPLGWEVGYFFWGFVIDRTPLARRPRVIGRLLVLLAAAGPILLLSALVPHPLLATGAFFAAMIVAAGFIIVSLSYATHAFGTVHAGYLAGLGAGSWSAVVMVVMPLFGQLVDARAFPAAFVIAAIFPAIGVAAWARLAPHPPTLTVS